MRTVTCCEIAPYCLRVMQKHWPTVLCYDDVRTLSAEQLRTDSVAADVICGGFPCQDMREPATAMGEMSGILTTDAASCWQYGSYWHSEKRQCSASKSIQMIDSISY